MNDTQPRRLRVSLRYSHHQACYGLLLGGKLGQAWRQVPMPCFSVQRRKKKDRQNMTPLILTGKEEETFPDARYFPYQ